MAEDAIITVRTRAADALRLSQELKEPNAVRMLREMAADLQTEVEKLEAKEEASRPAIPLHEK